MNVTLVGAVVGAGVDQLLGEPPLRWHPVARYGSLMERVERTTYADSRSAGTIHLLIGMTSAVGVGLALRRVLGPGVAVAAATFACAAGKMLDAEAIAIADHLGAGDVAAARARVRSLVGRTADELETADISRAVIESVAENCVDAVTASLFWAAIGGAPAVLAHRAVNTLDAMVGHRNSRYERFGWASARLDDAINFVPARLTAVAVALVHPRRAADIARVVRRDAPQHPSPNGGVVEAAFAAALGVRLGGINRYGDAVEDRGTLGDGHPPQPADVGAAVRLRRRCTIAVAVVLGVVPLTRYAIGRRRSR